ncbi:FCD domain-containing protein [Psychrobacillus sp. FJAT-21963]|uniref:FCD domain-containing protein n=1 Tax=Psychrobacillus sp. FJAT-21963 TaxID=1712028 RepID=UPI0006F8C485|nr:FCD domain-containing protein [Psychrobacillus sp. FJAT-21963]KQL36878.1 hypothetical protein AN959_02120 [Psychrobacillus sp. FJAT-21963]
MKMSKELFSNESDFHYLIALQCLSDSEKPLGSWIMKEKMESLGDSISLASVGRLLKELDGLGWTELVSSQGRILTAKGQRQLEALQIDVERLKIEAEMKEATDPENAQDIIDLLNVRVIIESEVIKSVIENASDEEIGRLEDSVKRHKQCVSMGEDTELLPINFHQVLCTLSCNRFLNSVLKLLIHEELRLEEKFPEIATKLRDAHHLVEHELILEAVKSRDVERAILLTKSHIQKLIQSVTN